MNETYFFFLPIDLSALIQLYVKQNDLLYWCTLIPYCNEKIYWQYFYSFFINDWILIINNRLVSERDKSGSAIGATKPDNLSYLEQYKKLLNLESGDIFDSARNGKLDNIVYLINIGIEINLQNYYRETALMIASEYGNIETIEYLIKKGANIDLPDNDGWTALIIASRNGNLEIVKYLIEKGSNIDLPDNDGRTALTSASIFGHIEIVKYLVEKGAKIDLPDNDRRTALMYASIFGHPEIVKYLESL